MILALLACGGPCKAGGEPTLELGLGFDAYYPTVDGDEALLVAGNQGGNHIDIAFLATNLHAADTVAATMSATLDGTDAGGGQPWFDLVCEDDGLTAFGLRLFIDAPRLIVRDRVIDVQAAITDSKGNVATATRQLLVIEGE